jgi:hypothetical protein
MPAKRILPTDDDGARAFTLAKSHLGEGAPGVTVAEDGNRAELSLLGISFANIERTGRSVVASFLVHESDRPALPSMLGYAPDPIRAGWWRIRLGKEPRRWTEANVATLAGRTMAALRQTASVGRWRSVLAASGAYALVSRTRIGSWQPLSDKELASPRIRTTSQDGTSALLVPATGALFVKLEDRGALLILDAAAEPRDEHKLRELVAGVPEDALTTTPVRFEVDGPVVAFDAARSGASLEVGSTLGCDLAPGTYEVRVGSHAMAGKHALSLVRLVLGDRSER